jgi:hypothetical protein
MQLAVLTVLIFQPVQIAMTRQLVATGRALSHKMYLHVALLSYFSHMFLVDGKAQQPILLSMQMQDGQILQSQGQVLSC